MPVSKQKKTEIFADVTEVLKRPSVLFVNFHGLTVANSTLIRKQLHVEKVDYLVAKKSITKKILGQMKIEGELPTLEGELAIVSSSDLIAPAREIYTFQKKFEGKLAIQGGIFEGTYKSKETMIEIASIPSLTGLRGMFVNVINSPIQGFVVALDAIAQKKTV